MGQIASANAGTKNLFLTWTRDQPVALQIPNDLLPEGIAAGWDWVRVEKYRPWFIVIADLRWGAKRPYLKAETGRFLLDLRPLAPLAARLLRVFDPA